MMSRDYKYEPALSCNSCGALGVYDVMGDAICADCLASDGATIDSMSAATATLGFNLDTPDGERRLRECLNAPTYLAALCDLDNWLRDKIKHYDIVELQPARDKLWEILGGHGIDIWEE